MKGLVVGLALMLCALSPADAHGYHHYRHHYAVHHVLRHHHYHHYTAYRSHAGYKSYGFVTADPRPGAWCGWFMRHLIGVADKAYNLARNWAHWGHAGPPGVGAVVVWPHHVGKIVGQEHGQWVVESGNDGHAVRTRPRSVRGAIAFRWGSSWATPISYRN